MFTLPFYHSRFPLTRYGIATYGYGMARTRKARSIVFGAEHTARLDRLHEATRIPLAQLIALSLDVALPQLEAQHAAQLATAKAHRPERLP